MPLSTAQTSAIAQRVDGDVIYPIELGDIRHSSRFLRLNFVIGRTVQIDIYPVRI